MRAEPQNALDHVVPVMCENRSLVLGILEGLPRREEVGRKRLASRGATRAIVDSTGIC